MNIEELREYCIPIKGGSESLPFIDPSILAFKVMDKMFAYIALNPKDGISKVNLKCDSKNQWNCGDNITELPLHRFQNVVVEQGAFMM